MGDRGEPLTLETIWGFVVLSLIGLALMAFAGWLVWDWATTPDKGDAPYYNPYYGPIYPGMSMDEIHNEIAIQQECESIRRAIDVGAEWLTQEDYWFLAHNCR